MTTPHTPPAALLDVAAIEARAAAATCPRCHGRGTVYDSTSAGYLVERQCVACLGAGRPSSDVLALLAALRTLAAQHAADVAAAVAAERARARMCTIYSERFDGCSMIDALQAARGMIENGEDDEVCEYCHDTGVNAASSKPCRCCEWARVLAADALAAPTGGGE